MANLTNLSAIVQQNNVTQVFVPPSFSDYATQAVTAFQGLVMSGTNGLLLFTILSITSLRKRKEMLLIAVLALSEIIYGIGTLLIGIYRFLILFYGLQNDPLSAWDCLLQSPYAIIFIGSYLSPVMGVVISVDRFVAVNWPLKYRSLDQSYAKKILFGLLVLCALSFVSLMASTYFYIGPVFPNTRVCSYPHPRWFGQYWYSLLPIFGWFSVIVYIGVFLNFRRSSKLVLSGSSNDQTANIQRRLTVTLGILTLSTLLFYAIPWTIIIAFLWMNKVLPYQPVFAGYTRICPIIHVIIFVYRQREIRSGMRNILFCKKHQGTSSVAWGRNGLSRGPGRPGPTSQHHETNTRHI